MTGMTALLVGLVGAAPGGLGAQISAATDALGSGWPVVKASRRGSLHFARHCHGDGPTRLIAAIEWWSGTLGRYRRWCTRSGSPSQARLAELAKSVPPQGDLPTADQWIVGYPSETSQRLGGHVPSSQSSPQVLTMASQHNCLPTQYYIILGLARPRGGLGKC
jgi:hypothetical protein